MDIYNELLETKYNMWIGPLWKVKMIIPKDNERDENNEFLSVLIFSVQHVIADSTTNMKLCRVVVQILNEMNAGNDVKPQPEPLMPVLNDILNITPSAMYLTRYFFKRFTSTILKNFSNQSSFNKTFPIPETNCTKTKALFDELTEVETAALLKKCKNAQITVHSCIVTITNFALLNLAQSKSSNPLGSCTISVNHSVNIRRHLPQEYSDSSGSYISFLENTNEVSLEDLNDFWTHAQKIHASIRNDFTIKKKHLEIFPILPLYSLIFPTNNFLTRNKMKNKTDCHYNTTNMGNLKTLLPAPKEEDDIEIVNIRRSTSCHLLAHPFSLIFHTFRNRFMISIDYYSSKMTEDVANEFFQILCQCIRNVANSGNLNNLS